MELERPELKQLQFVGPHQVRPEHIELLRKLEPYCLGRTTAVQMAHEIWQGALWLWQVGEPMTAIVLTRVHDGDTLHLDGIAGSGIMAVAQEVVSDLKTIAREYGLSRITTTAARDGWIPSAEPLGFKQISTNYEMEVDDGREAAEDDDAGRTALG